MTRPVKVNCGLLQQPLLGAFGFNSSKAGGGGTQPGRCIAYMFAMRVEEELPVWPEKAQRNRLWVSLIASPVSCGNSSCLESYSQQPTDNQVGIKCAAEVGVLPILFLKAIRLVHSFWMADKFIDIPGPFVRSMWQMQA